MNIRATLAHAKILAVCALIGVIVALIYLLFESAVSFSTNYVWNSLFHSNTFRWIIFPLALIIGMLFFGLQQWLDPGSQNRQEHSLGGKPINPTLKNFSIVLLLGFFSLLAGASLGPEAILVPASVITGGYLGVKLFKNNKQLSSLLAGAAIIALMAAFFHSFFVGLLAILLVVGQFKTKVSWQLILIGIAAAGSSYLTLELIDPTNAYLNLPHITWQVAVIDILAAAILIALGYASTFGLKYTHAGITKFRTFAKLTTWWKLGMIAGLGMGIIYFIGGPLIQFTGNEAIKPLYEQAGSAGIFILIGILIAKIIAIAWSKAMGYRGGLIFPMIFVASALALIVIEFLPSAQFGIGLIAALIGIIAAERKAKILL